MFQRLTIKMKLIVTSPSKMVWFVIIGSNKTNILLLLKHKFFKE